MAKYTLHKTTDFKKDVKRLRHDKQALEKLSEILNTLAQGQTLEPKYKDHKLQGEFSECRECHIKPDLLLIYKKQDENLILICIRLGSHSELF